MNTFITEMTEQGEIPVNVYQKMASNRILFINSDIDDRLASDIVATLLALDLDHDHSGEKISLFINSPGGDIRNILMIYDTMNILSSPIETVCIGSAMDEAAILLCSGTPGMRVATKNAIISVGPLLHNNVSRGSLTDAKKILDLHKQDNKIMMDIFAKSTKKTLKQILHDFDRKNFMTAQQALNYGLIDLIVNSK